VNTHLKQLWAALKLPEKLQKKDAGLLAELKEAILESDKTIEQERLL